MRSIGRAVRGLLFLTTLAPLGAAQGQGWAIVVGADVGRAAELHWADWRNERTFAGTALAVERANGKWSTGLRARWSLMPVTFEGTKTCTGPTSECANPRERQEVAQLLLYQRRAFGRHLDLTGGIGGGWYRRQYVSSAEVTEVKSEAERKAAWLGELGAGTRLHRIRLSVRVEGGVLPGVRNGVLLDCPTPGSTSSTTGTCREARRSIGFHRVALSAELPLVRWGALRAP